MDRTYVEQCEAFIEDLRGRLRAAEEREARARALGFWRGVTAAYASAFDDLNDRLTPDGASVCAMQATRLRAALAGEGDR